MNEGWIDPDVVTLEDSESYTVIAFDPGGTTGWSLFAIHPEAMGPDPLIPVAANIDMWAAGEFTGVLTDQVDEVVELCASWPDARLVTEDFHLRQMDADLAPVEVNAMMAWALRPRYFIKQQANLAMSMVTDDRQKSWGFWLPGKPHARDAIKHNLTFLRRMKERAVRAGSGAAAA